MTYATYEQSVEDGDPLYRVLFAYASTEYRYTNSEVLATDSGGNWVPEAITFSEFSQTNEMAKDPLKITLPIDNPLAQQFLGGIPEFVVSVTVFRLHASDTSEEYRFYWKGRVAGVSVNGQALALDCENIFTSLRRPGLREKYQIGCRHALYGRGCGLDKSSFAVAGTVTAVSGTAVTIAIAQAENYFLGGMIELSGGIYRDIMSNDSSGLVMMRPLKALEDATLPLAVTLYPGCAHNLVECNDKFSNLLNYGGCPHIPSKNPFGNDVNGSIA